MVSTTAPSRAGTSPGRARAPGAAAPRKTWPRSIPSLASRSAADPAPLRVVSAGRVERVLSIGRAGVAFTDEAIARLHAEGLIGAPTDAGGELSRPPRLVRPCGPGSGNTGLPQFSGDDATALVHRAMGRAGCMSVTPNVAPTLCSALQAAFDAGDMAGAGLLRNFLAPLNAALFTEANLIPRLPLTRAEAATSAPVARALRPVMEAEEARAPDIIARARRVA